MIKTRFAPSPTGYLHVGSLRTALYCYLFAKKNKGKFILRIEDTDQERFVEGAVENLLSTLSWVGLNYDEGLMEDGKEVGENGPYIQSKRKNIHLENAQKLIDSGHAYRCFCSKERLTKMREIQAKNKQAPMYDRKCLDLPESEINAKLSSGEPYVIRQRMPYDSIRFKDIIRGNMQFDGKTIDDQILVKSDGFPTYHLANVVDDHLMEITHVIRGEEWLPSTPKHIALYQAFGWDVPEFAHLPLLLNPDKTKLSKRQGHVAVEEYIKEGYLKEAVINFVAFLGWNPGSGEQREIFTLKELEKIFELKKVHKSGAVFNIEKLDWFNWQWHKKKFNEEMTVLAKELDKNVEITNRGFDFSNQEAEEAFLLKKGKKLKKYAAGFIPKEYENTPELLTRALSMLDEKILKNKKETAKNLAFFFNYPEYSKELLTNKKMKVDLNQAYISLSESLKDIKKIEDWTLQNLKESLFETVKRLDVKNGQVFWPLRAALSGMQFSPGVFETAWALGKEESLSRIAQALKKLQ
ncbi:glutamate--tRNA ligase [Candidatus Peregrinibacteria bacterium]|nr:glutamate--tRNA ligase [Candidatus Peregrinibacteria bacterium]